MPNHLNQPDGPIVERRTVLEVIAAMVTVSLVGCGKGESNEELALPTDPYAALEELRTRIDKKIRTGRFSTDFGLDGHRLLRLLTSDGGRVEMSLRPSDYNRVIVALFTPAADWFSFAFSNGTTSEGGRYIEAMQTVLPGTHGLPQWGARVLLTHNPETTTSLIWMPGETEAIEDADLSNSVLDQLLGEAARFIALENNALTPAVPDIQYKA